ncbi:MAG: hypothetical protein QXR84_07515 [Candidatus Bathyarchaeia archaeon]
MNRTIFRLKWLEFLACAKNSGRTHLGSIIDAGRLNSPYKLLNALRLVRKYNFIYKVIV